MATASTHIRIDPALKKQAADLFSELGTDMSGAINMFLRQCVLRNGIPFPIEKPMYNQRTLDAMDEAIRITNDPDVPAYHTMEEYKAALLEDDNV